MMNLKQLKTGAAATVTEISGSRRTTERLAAMGISPGTRLVKRSSAIMQGPIVVRIADMEIAISHGMALKIITAPVAE
jgi:Fe2+ transport system protein FeoA